MSLSNSVLSFSGYTLNFSLANSSSIFFVALFRTLLYRFISSLRDFWIRLLSLAISFSLKDKLFLQQRSLFLILVTMQNFSTILKIRNVNSYVEKSQLQFVRELFASHQFWYDTENVHDLTCQTTNTPFCLYFAPIWIKSTVLWLFGQRTCFCSTWHSF